MNPQREWEQFERFASKSRPIQAKGWAMEASDCRTLVPDESPTEGILLVNLGTPASPEPRAVRAYLQEFLMDPWVIDLPWILRWALVHLIIGPFRSPRSARLYQAIWSPQGSPLLLSHLGLGEALQRHLDLPSHAHSRPCPTPTRNKLVKTAMRYGGPSIEQALTEFKHRGVLSIKVIPLYPQFATSTSFSTIEFCQKFALRLGLECRYLPSFAEDPDWIRCVADACFEKFSGNDQARHQNQFHGPAPQEEFEGQLPFDHLLLSFHGIPERHLRAQGIEGCDLGECCRVPSQRAQYCYRGGAFLGAQRIAAEVGAKSWSVGFQSRLGSDKWLQPATEAELKRLARSGVRRLAVMTPSFVADCLETLEEIAVQGRETFLRAGGEELTYIECLNARPSWVNTLGQWVGDDSRFRDFDEIRKGAFPRRWGLKRDRSPLLPP